jgi:signal transduction protein with GAF and PtsI domain
VLDQVAYTLDADAAAVLLIDPELQSLKFTAGRKFRGTAISQSEIRVGEDYSGHAAMQREIVHILELRSADKFSRLHLLEGEEFVSYYGASLSSKGRIKGVLELHERPVHGVRRRLGSRHVPRCCR